MESSLAASKKCFLKSSARLRTAVQVMQRAGSIPCLLRGLSAQSSTFGACASPGFAGGMVKKAAGCAPQKASASRAGQSRLRAAPLRNKSSAAGTALPSPVFGPQGGRTLLRPTARAGNAPFQGLRTPCALPGAEAEAGPRHGRRRKAGFPASCVFAGARCAAPSCPARTLLR